jgi:hypothetical protein
MNARSDAIEYAHILEQGARNSLCNAFERHTPAGWVKVRITGRGVLVWFVNDKRVSRAFVINSLEENA